MSASPAVVAAAIAQMEAGFAAFALRANAKVPITEHGFKNATTKPDWIETQLQAPGAGNYGIVWPVEAPPVVCFDLDDGGGADRPWQDRLLELIARLGPLPKTKHTNTPSGGRHAFYRWPIDVPIPAGDELFGFTVRWPGRGYLVGPGSSIDGRDYVAGPESEIADLPGAWVAAAVAERPAAKAGGAITITGSFELPDRIPSGRRYATIRDYVASRYNSGLTLDELWELVKTQVVPRFDTAKDEATIRADFDRATAKMVERLGPPANGPEVRREVGPGIDAADLLALEIQPLRWLVPDLIPEGTTILAAPPKVGKSCLIYQIAVEAAIGGDLLGRRVTSGSVLYLALEDGKRRGRDRLMVALAGRTMPRGRLEVRWDANRIGAGLEDDIRLWLDEHDDAVMVAVDTLGKVRPRSTGKQGAYEVDVQDLAQLQDLFRDRPVALVIVHHARKEASDDFLASVSGTYGITGSADTIIAIRRKRLERYGTVMTTGRDIADAEVSVEFVDGRWLPAPQALSAASFERSEIYSVIESDGPIFAKAIGDRLGMERTNVQHRVEALVETGAVARVTGGYVVAKVRVEPSNASNTPSHSSHSLSDHSDGGDITREAPSLRVVPPTSAGWVNPCLWYADHQTNHRQTPSGWTCDACHPEETA